MKIPTHWKEQHLRSQFDNVPVASDFQFVWSKKGSESCIKYNYQLSSEDEGRMLFFPSGLYHQVYPFYGTEEERITINGTISLNDPNFIKLQERMLIMMEERVEILKEELKQMKKVGEERDI
jgi:hypothetical protein